MSVIKINQCDNELILVATTPTDSFVICNIKSGNYNKVDVTINLVNGAYTAPVELNGVNQPISGDYNVQIPHNNVNIAIMGMNWGGPANFDLSIDGTPYTYSSQDVTPIVWAGGDPFVNSLAARQITASCKTKLQEA